MIPMLSSFRKVVLNSLFLTFFFCKWAPSYQRTQWKEQRVLKVCKLHFHMFTSSPVTYIYISFIILHPSRRKNKQRHHISSIPPPKKKTITKTTRPSPSPIRRRLSLLHDTLPLHHHLDQPLESFWPPAADLDLTVLVAAEDPNQPVQVSPGRIVEIQRTGTGTRNLQLTVRFLPGKLRAGMVDTWPDHHKHISVFFLCFWIRRKGLMKVFW